MLRAIRNVNHLITQEENRDKLIQEACNNLTETRGYQSAWIALVDETGGFVKTVESGWGDDFQSMAERLRNCEIPTCIQSLLIQPGAVIIKDPSITCSDCFMSDKYHGREAISTRLEYGGKIYGLLSASIPVDFATHEEEQSLFEEVAGDIAFALHDMELEEERQRMDEELKESEERYRRFFETSKECVFITSKDGRWIDANQAVVELFGYKNKEELLKNDARKLYESPDERKRYIELVEKQGFSKDYPVNLRNKDGNIINVIATSVSTTDENCNMTGHQGTFRDITESKCAEEALLQYTHELDERVKELNCLYGISNLLEKLDVLFEEVLQGTVELIPPAWQYPEITCARIIVDEKEFETANFKETKWGLLSDIFVSDKLIGSIEVYLLEERPESKDGYFLHEERKLLNAVAELIGRTIERIRPFIVKLYNTG